MNKHFKPATITLKEFWAVIEGEEHETFDTQMAAEENLRRSREGSTLWHCIPGECVMRDITEDLAWEWFHANAEPYSTCPEAFEPYVGDEVRALTDRLEDGGRSRFALNEHSTHYRGIGL